ncbi:uncharacterized protein PGTG_06177 [Puccinia graminis f. sp. tritici CRL 75-36-700-3]|uniref:Protein CPL1-like domain-containing protein n=1 Tax=Puccinia graminis f. sp. tritici (strain CRL 75-36-700-3 / race SCCL) TaxID=418459 RepID=E3K807_PUCGT|nr:uncharacterized protein PGTG_06177 [Puccinia graminis f. sp. tritici CRL 75-36-700-3]EFP80221.1 hypothetical protein PGTG_06177 [Puccinia graminis f. sp. tritici CRL 75-36-700-3]
MAPSATGTHLYARQLFPGQFLPGQLTAGQHTAAQVSAGTAQASAGCGLESNVWGQVSPVSASGYANLCLQCRVNVFGVEIFEFNFYNALAASISAHGVSASQVSVLQSAIDGDLLRLSAGSKTSASCTASCAGDQRCDSCSFVNGSCRMKAVNYLNQNRAGAPLAQAFQGLYSNGGSGYCSICPNLKDSVTCHFIASDRSCSGPKPSGLPRRSVAAKNPSVDERCPAGLSACPISSGLPLKLTAGFECLDVLQEVSSCGGCVSTGQGTDCTTIKGVSSAGCSEGKCKICKPLHSASIIVVVISIIDPPTYVPFGSLVSCKAGYQYSPVNNACYKSHRSTKMA